MIPIEQTGFRSNMNSSRLDVDWNKYGENVSSNNLINVSSQRTIYSTSIFTIWETIAMKHNRQHKNYVTHGVGVNIEVKQYIENISAWHGLYTQKDYIQYLFSICHFELYYPPNVRSFFANDCSSTPRVLSSSLRPNLPCHPVLLCVTLLPELG